MNHTQNYLAALQKEHATGKATEHSYRPALQSYLQGLVQGIHAVNEPRRQQCGAPDYVVERLRKGESIPIGYIEAKDLQHDLDKVEKTVQMQRYLASLDNIILTNYLEFRFFVNKEKVATVTIATLSPQGITLLPEQFSLLERHLAEFAEYRGQSITSPVELAERMAKKAQLMRDVFYNALTDKAEPSQSLHAQLTAFQKILIHDMDAAQFADVYAQTIAYGLFTARLHDQTPEDFSRAEARELIPRSNPFLRRLFDYVCGADLDDRVVWIIDALCEVFLATDIHAIMQKFSRKSGRQDPVIHFYETFLACYDPKLRKSRGVWYTPEPVVNFIVRAVDEVLKTHFDLPEGLADTSKVTIEVDDIGQDKRRKDNKAKRTEQVHRVQLLDVAAGTGTFTAEAIRQIHERFIGQEGMWSSYVEAHLLPRLHGFEILMASYAMCHLKIDLLLRELGYQPSNVANPPRLSVYLTNALEEYHPDENAPLLAFMRGLAEEGLQAGKIKRDMPIMVAYGNPPYSGKSANAVGWIDGYLEDYKKEPNSQDKLKERNAKWLNDDYVKFIRLAEHYIERNKSGVLGFITNHGYLDNPTFRGMRWHLLNTFDDIYVLDLHGNAKKKEIAPDGSPDKNVFDIQQGVAIIIAVKHGKRKGTMATLRHAEIWGGRNDKYAYLAQQSLASVGWQTLNPTANNHLFIPFDNVQYKQYEKSFLVAALFPVNSVGIVTARDSFTIHDTKQQLLETIYEFVNIEAEMARIKYSLGEDVRDWKVKLAQKDLTDSNLDEKNIVSISYRPFDVRYTYYTGKSKGFHCMPRNNVMRHFVKRENIAINLCRQNKSSIFSHVFINNFIPESSLVSNKTSEISYCFPLYLYPDTDAQETQTSMDYSVSEEQPKRKPNLDPNIIAKLSKKLKLPFVPDHEEPSQKDKSQFSPLDVLDYIYAVLHSPIYRTTYKEFLKIDFPRIPYPDNAEDFWQLVRLGAELRKLHLLEHSALATPTTTFPMSGDCMVENINRDSFRDIAEGKGSVYINAVQYIGNVPVIAWEFFIGGYQPAQKWLKDRKGRQLSFEDIRHYQKIITALTETQRLMQEIDGVVELA